MRKKKLLLHDKPAGAYRFGQHDSGCVHSLEDALQIDPSSDLSDQNWSDPFGAKLLVDTKEVDLNHFLFSRAKKKERKNILNKTF